MLKFLTGSIQAKLLAIVVAMFGLLAITVGLNFQAFGSLDGSAPAIDQAGAQRMRTYKLAALANEYYQSDEAARDSIKPDLELTISQFGTVQTGLADGDSTLNLTGTKVDEIRSQLDVVNQEWETYKTDLETILASDTVAQEAVARINGSATAVFSSAATVVTALDQSRIGAGDLDQAGAQRMRTYKLAFLANAYRDASVSERPDLAAAMNTTIGEFDSVLIGLRSGDSALGLDGTSDASVLSALSAVDAAWPAYKADLQSSITSGNVDSVIERIDHAAPSIFGLTAQVVKIQNAGQVSLVDLDQAGAQRMRVFRTAFLANSYITARDTATRESLAEELHNTVMQVDNVLAGLRDGDAALGLAGSSDSRVIAALDDAASGWAAYRVDLEEVLQFDTAAVDSLGAIGAAASTLFSEANQGTQLISQDSQGIVSSLKVLEIVMLAVGLVVMAAVVWFIRSTIVKQLTVGTQLAREVSEKDLPRLLAALKAMANGDLTQKFDVSTTRVDVKSSDEVGQVVESLNSVVDRLGESGLAFDDMSANMRDLIGQVGDTANSLADASGELSSAASETGEATQDIANISQNVAKDSDEQTRGVDETSAAMEQLSGAIDQIAQGSQDQASTVEQASTIVNQVSAAITEVASSAQAAADGSTQANDAAKIGLDMVNKTVDGMGKIKTAVEVASKQVADLGEQSEEIGKIVVVIDDIAAQTNLLALNAAIEAARAGEQGRGFAVVADEVRGLAERVTDATKEIAGLIDTVQKGVTESVKAIDEGTKEVANGVDQAEQSGQSLGEIMTSVNTVGQRIEEISASAEEVSASSDEMVKTIENVNAVAEETSASAEQMAASSTQVSKSIDGIADISRKNGSATQNVSASAQEMSAQVQQVVASSQSLAQMANDLQKAVGAFDVGEDSKKKQKVTVS
jgi:methyl-accepting chemotaxis protein